MKRKLILTAVPAMVALCALAGCGEGNGGGTSVIPDSGEFDLTKATITGASAEVTAELGTRYTIPVPTVEYNGTKREVTFEVLDSENTEVDLVARGTRFYVESVNDYKINYYITYLGESKLVASSNVSVLDTKGPEIILPASAYTMTVYKDSTVKIPVPTIRDGSGHVESSAVKVTFNGSAVDITEGAEGELGSFVAANYGNYTIEYSATDGSDNTTVETVNVNCARMITLCDFDNLDVAQAGNAELTTEHAYSGNALKIDNAQGLWITLKVFPTYYNLSGFDRFAIHVWASRACNTGSEGFYLLNQKFTLQEGDNIITFDKETFYSQYPNGMVPSSNPSYATADYIWFQPYGNGVTFIVDNFVGIFDSYEEDKAAPTIDFGKATATELSRNEGVLFVNEERELVVPTDGIKAYDNSLEAVGDISYTVKVKGGADITEAVKAGTYIAKLGETYEVTYSATDATGNTGTRLLNIVTRTVQLPEGNDLPTDNKYDVLQSFDAADGVSANGLKVEATERYAREGKAVMVESVSAKSEIKIRLLKDGAALTDADFAKYQHYQLTIVSNADNVFFYLGGKKFTLAYGYNKIELWGELFADELAAGAYEAEGWLKCAVEGECKLYFDQFLGICAKEDEAPVDPKLIYDELQSFDVTGGGKVEASNCVLSGTADHATKGFATKVSDITNWVTLLMGMRKDGKILKRADFAAYDYIQFTVYAEKAGSALFFMEYRIDLAAGMNVVKLDSKTVLERYDLNPNVYYPATGSGAGMVNCGIAGGAGNTFYFDNAIGVYPEGYVRPDPTDPVEEPWELPDTNRHLDELQKFDAVDGITATGGTTIEISTAYAVKDNMIKVTPVSNNGFTLSITFKKGGELLTAWDLKNYDYVQFSVYSEATCAMFFFDQRVDFQEGKNTVKFSGAKLAELFSDKYYNANGVTGCWVDGVTAGKAIYFDHMVGVYPADYDPENPPVRPVEPEKPEEPDEPVGGVILSRN